MIYRWTGTLWLITVTHMSGNILDFLLKWVVSIYLNLYWILERLKHRFVRKSVRTSILFSTVKGLELKVRRCNINRPPQTSSILIQAYMYQDIGMKEVPIPFTFAYDYSHTLWRHLHVAQPFRAGSCQCVYTMKTYCGFSEHLSLDFAKSWTLRKISVKE